MCGIASAFAYRTGDAPREFIAGACSRMTCRGPDGDGVWANPDGSVLLGHRRLSIIDLSSRARQPMVAADGNLAITYNGEIYNYRDLRSQLERKGYRFRTGSDTEVILQLYDDRGVAMLNELRGMFAFALWDERKGELVLARDPFGIKPLYYSDDGSFFCAASEVKALRGYSSADTSPEPAGHVGFFLWGYVPEPYTLYRGIRALPPGSVLTINRSGKQRIEAFAKVEELITAAAAEGDITGGRPAMQVLREALLDSVRHHLVADVPIGVFLSAGIDSSALTALAAEEADAALRTLALGFEEFRGTPFDETIVAQATAERYGTDHGTIWVTRDDFRNSLDRILDRMDQPTIDGVNSFLVAKAAADAGLKVALSGLGGDELFGSYSSFRDVPRMVSAISRVPMSRALGRGVRAVLAPAVGRLTSPKYAGLLEYGGSYPGAYLLRRGVFMPWELEQILDSDLVEAGLTELDFERALGGVSVTVESSHLRMSALEANWYMRNQLLRDTDWASMSHSVEIRVPMVDWNLWRSTAGVIARSGMRKEDLGAVTRPTLPRSVTGRAKTGFATPVARWLELETGAKAERGLRTWLRFVYARATDQDLPLTGRGLGVRGTAAYSAQEL